jgi:hypothetical protein
VNVVPKGISSSEAKLIASAKRRLPALIAKGLTHWQIAERVGLSRCWVDRHSMQMGLKSARTGPRAGSLHPNWKEGRTIEKHGYVTIWMPMHPGPGKTGRCWEHRIVWEVANGRFLKDDEVVHHRDDHPRHNWPSNLEMFASNGQHLAHELSGQSTPNPKGGARPSSRWKIPNAYGSIEKLPRCPGESVTLRQCPAKIREKLAWYIESFRPTIEHQNLAHREFHRRGAHRDPFGEPSKA